MDHQSRALRNSVWWAVATTILTIIGIWLLGRFIHGELMYFGFGAVFILIIASAVGMRVYLRGNGVNPMELKQYMARSPFFFCVHVILLIFVLRKWLV
jgi:hypothetical protein